MEYEKLIERETIRRIEEARRMGIMDANMWLGKGREFPLAPVIGPEDLEGIYDNYFITGGLISHWNALSMSAQDANESLLEAETSLPDNTWTIWTALPLLPHEQDPLPGFGPPSGKMRGVRIFPKTHRYECASWVLGDLCSWCIEYKVPLFIWHVEADWSGLYSIAREFPLLTLIIETQWQKILYHNRTLYNLLNGCPNVLVETSNLAGQDLISHGVKSFGAQRFIYGSFLPMSDPFVSLGMLMDADLSEEEKRSIAGGTLRKLIIEVKK